jgi:rubredoxin
MDTYVCKVCGYIYNPEKGDSSQNIAPGTAFEGLPEDWLYPECGAGKEMFEKTRVC